MAEPQDDRKLIEVLYEQGLLTEEQVRRVQATLDAGRDLGWALSHLPLVEHLHFLKARSFLESGGIKRSSGGTPTPLPTPLPLGPSATWDVRIVGRPERTPPTDSDRPRTVASDLEEDAKEEKVQTWDIEDKDYGAGFEGVARPLSGDPTPPEGPTAASPAAPLTPPAPRHPSAPPTPALSRNTPIPSASPAAPASPGDLDPAHYARTGISPSTYDLADDEGIPLVSRVNALFAEALDTGVRQIVLRSVPEGIALQFVSQPNTAGTSRLLEREEGDRICNRLKIMARVEPWRKAPQKGTFHLLHHKRQFRVLVDILAPSRPAEPEELQLFLLPHS
jgi:hypothetical protein